MRLRAAVLAVGSLLAALLLAELVLRLLAPVEYRRPPERRENAWRAQVHRPSQVPGLSYELAPNVDAETDRGRVRTNSFGMRDRERRLAAEPGTVRLAVLGDSFTFGFGVEAEEAYPAVLERLLNAEAPTTAEAPSVAEARSVAEVARPLAEAARSLAEAGEAPRFEVLNFGVGGYSTRDELAAFEHEVRTFRPRLVLLGYVLNDPEIDPVQPLHAYFAPTAWWQRFHLTRLVARAANARAVERYGGGNYTRYLHAEPRKWGSVVVAFAHLHELAEADGFEVAVVIFPLIPSESWESYPFRAIHEQVATAARGKRLGVIDLLPSLAAHPPAEISLSAGDRHPNRLGHEVAARAIYDRIRELYPHLIEEPPP